jgi:NADH dehydrogenase (ubiquinone) 1 alpha subcomplex subunit 6
VWKKMAGFLKSIPTTTSKNVEEATKSALRLYREAIRGIPRMKQAYQLDMPKEQIRRRIRQEFERNKNVTSVDKMDFLLFKGRVELQEAMNMWKTKSHVIAFLHPPKYDDLRAPQNDFVKRFLAGFEHP